MDSSNTTEVLSSLSPKPTLKAEKEDKWDQTTDTIWEVAKKRHKLYLTFPLVQKHLTLSDIMECAKINSVFNQRASVEIWKDPQFQKISHVHDSLFVFNQFLDHLKIARPRILSLVGNIDISYIEENLYDRVNPDFFRLLVKHCGSSLSSINLANASFFSLKSLPTNNKTFWSLPQLTYLNISNCSRINDEMIVQLARGCRQLTKVRLDHLPQHKGKGLACLAVECDKLEAVSVRFNTSLGDEAIVALGKFRNIRLSALDMTGCKNVSRSALEVLARYAAHITFLSLAETSCSINELKKFVCLQNRTVFLDISGCKSLLQSMSANALSDWVWNTEFKALESFTMNYSTAQAIVKLSQQEKLIDTSLTIRQVTRLTIADLPERTQMVFLTQLLEMFPNVKHVVFTRGDYETDFLLGTYTTRSPEENGPEITDKSLNQYNISQRKVVATICHKRTEDISVGQMNW